MYLYAANKYTFVWRKSVEKNKAKLEVRIQNILSQIDEGIAHDNASESDQISSAIDANSLRERIDELNRENRERSKEEKTQLKELEKHQEKLAEYEEKLDILDHRNSYSKTDTDATFMRMKEDAMNNGQTKPGYNVQIGTENQFITNFGLYNNPTDTTTLPSFLTLDEARLGRIPKVICADSGYGSEENYALLEQEAIQAYVKYNYFHKEQHRPFKNNPFLIENLYYNPKDDYFVCPMGQHMLFVGQSTRTSQNGYKSYIRKYQAANCGGCPLKGQCSKAGGNRIIQVNHQLAAYKRKARKLLLSEEGLKHRSRRPIEPEAVFGQMKYNMAYKRFRHRGFAKVQMDFAVFAMAFNLQKLFRSLNKAEKTLLDKLKENFLRLWMVSFYLYKTTLMSNEEFGEYQTVA